MHHAAAEQPPRFREGLIRREFLHAGAAAILGLGRPADQARAAPAVAVGSRDVNCILLFLVGGPSQLDTWDPKPDAPEEIRGPLQPIATRVPGIWISEAFPRLAGVMDKVSLVRTVHHTAAAVHDTGHQLMQTGRLFSDGIEHPHVGCVLAKLKGPRGETPPHVLLPRPIGPTGGNMPRGQNAGYLGAAFDPFVLPAEPKDGASGVPGQRVLGDALDPRDEPGAIRDRYGASRFGRNCLRARRLVEHGVRFVTVNMFDTVFNETTWDTHGSAPFSAIADLQNEIGPSFDIAYTALLEDLACRGLLDTTMVLAFGEFGRTPRINPSGGRDHHPGCWTVLLAGGPIAGGRVVGASDRIGFAPRDRPVSPAEIAATVYHGLGVSLDTVLSGPAGRPQRLVEQRVEPIWELF